MESQYDLIEREIDRMLEIFEKACERFDVDESPQSAESPETKRKES